MTSSTHRPSTPEEPLLRATLSNARARFGIDATCSNSRAVPAVQAAESVASLAFACSSKYALPADSSAFWPPLPPTGLSANMNVSWRDSALFNLSPPWLRRRYPASTLLWDDPTSPSTSGVRRCLLAPYRHMPDPWRSLGVRLSNVPPLPPRILPRPRSEIGRRADEHAHPGPGSLQRGSLAFGAAVRFQLPFHTSSRQRLRRTHSTSASCSCLRLAVASDRPRKGLLPSIAQPCPTHPFGLRPHSRTAAAT